MRIDAVTPNNFLWAVQVYEASWKKSHREICSAAFLESRDYSGYLRERCNGLYLVWETEPVGLFRIQDGTLSDLYIHPDHWGKGYGTACVKYALERNTVLTLAVLSSNKRAINFYEKMGFRFTGVDIPRKNGLWEREMRYMEKNQ